MDTKISKLLFKKQTLYVQNVSLLQRMIKRLLGGGPSTAMHGCLEHYLLKFWLTYKQEEIFAQHIDSNNILKLQ